MFAQVTTSPLPRAWPLNYLGFALAISFSTLVIAERPGPLYMVAYLVVTLPLLYAILCQLMRRLNGRHDRAASVLLGVVLVGLTVAFLLIHPQIDLDGFTLPGVSVGGGDMDDAIDDGLRELLRGHYPYYVRTIYDSPLTPLPGALLLALPFYLLGNSALQNIFWLGIFALVAARHTGNISRATALLVTTLGFSPILLLHLFQGTDYIANNLYILVFVVMLADSVTVRVPENVTENAERNARQPGWASVGWAVLLGIGLASRLNYVLVGPLLYAYLVRRVGWVAATKLMAVVGITSGLITLPFYLYDPAGFSPLHVMSYASSAPQLPIAVAGALALLLAWLLPMPSPTRLLQAIFWVQIVLIATSMAAISPAVGSWAFDYARYGLLALFFGVLGFGVEFCRPHTDQLSLNRQ